MTTYIQFTPQPNQSPPFQTNMTLDGQSYTAIALWNFAGQRWYLSLIDQYNNTAWYGALIGSPLNANLYLALGVFQTSTLLFREDTGNFEVNP